MILSWWTLGGYLGGKLHLWIFYPQTPCLPKTYAP